MPSTLTADTWAQVVGQPEAVNQLKVSADSPLHAYLFVGPHGSGRWAAAKAFAAEILSHGLDAAAAERAVRLAARGEHPDLIRIEPTGQAFRKEEAKFLITEASRTPVEGSHKVIVADRFHTANATVIGQLLKTLEEPPESTIIALLSEEVPDEQITIASRCVKVSFRAVPHGDVVAWLVSQGADETVAETIALAAAGDLRRAADLMDDDEVAHRHQAWSGAPSRLDGTGAEVAVLVAELQALIDEAQRPIESRHELERETLDRREEQLGTRGSGRRDLEERHKREIKRHRADELRFGLATLAEVYRRRLDALPTRADVLAIDALREANENLVRNPNETLLLQALFLKLPRS